MMNVTHIDNAPTHNGSSQGLEGYWWYSYNASTWIWADDGELPHTWIERMQEEDLKPNAHEAQPSIVVEAQPMVVLPIGVIILLVGIGIAIGALVF